MKNNKKKYLKIKFVAFVFFLFCLRKTFLQLPLLQNRISWLVLVVFNTRVSSMYIYLFSLVDWRFFLVEGKFLYINLCIYKLFKIITILCILWKIKEFWGLAFFFQLFKLYFFYFLLWRRFLKKQHEIVIKLCLAFDRRCFAFCDLLHGLLFLWNAKE